MRGKAVSGKAILVLCLASFLAGSLITSRTWTSQSHNNNHPIVNHVTASNKLGEFDHKLRKLGEGKAEDIMGEVSKTHKAIQSLEKTISNLEMELAVSRMSSVGNGVTLQKPRSYSNHTLQKAFVVIGINTAFSSRKRRDSLRQTWMPTGEKLKKLEKEKGIVIRFVIGHSATTGGVLDKALDKEEAEHKDFLRLNHVEGYHQLSTKTRLYFSTAVSMWDAEFYVKVDDDVHLNLGMLATTLAQYRSKPRVYIGCMKSGPVLSEKGVKYHEPEYWKFGEDGNKYFRHATGQIYGISKDLAAYISINSPILHRYANEDVSLGSWLIGLEVEHVDDRSMCCGTPPGWSGHPVCKKRYHFIIKSSCDNGICANPHHISDSRRCKCCNRVDDVDVEEWGYSQLEDNNTHLLHGVVHSNGYGHLLTVNGREGGSEFLSGFHIMNFWDRLCTVLSVRKVTVMDVSKKYGMEYRPLHAIARGHSWYGNWGYEFGSGSYALTQDAYKRAVDDLSNMPLSALLFQGNKSRTRLQNIVAFYQSLSCLELSTFRDLFSFLLRLITDSHKASMPKASKMSKSSTNVLCAWTRNDVEKLQQGMIKVLMAAAPGPNWVSRRALKGVMCKAGSPELLDYCLKHLRGKLAPNGKVVEARSNLNSSDIEFRLQTPCSLLYDSNCPSEEHIKGDLRYMLDSLLDPETMSAYRPHATRERVMDLATKLLDCKQFLKDYKPSAHNPCAICVWCHLELSNPTKDDPVPPPELIILPLSATVGDLKTEATKVFEDVYAMFKRLQIEDLPDYGSVEDSITLKLLIGTTGSVRVRGKCTSRHGLNRFRMERGTENWTVDCVCGAKDDDGERMLACDKCSVWQHTRCAGIDNADAIPSMFICMRCTKSLHKKYLTITNSGREARNFSQQLNSSCRGNLGSNEGSQVTTTLIVR